MATGGFGMVDGHLRDKRILVVDDERDLADMVAAILHGAGFACVDVAHSGEEALARADGRTGASERYQLFVLDVMMPRMDGFELLARLRERPAYASAPAVFLTAKDEPFHRVSGLSLGADDYIAKPFLPQELMLRIAAVLRRCYAEESPLLELDACRVNFATAEVLRADGGTAQLTAKEHEILSVLARNAGRIVTIDALCEACWGTSFGYDNSLMAHIRRLREKIEADPSKPVSLVTARGLGYKLVTRP
ncbi:response regulator transcription factor [Rubneribacter sp.]